MTDDDAILLFLAAGVLILIGIVVFGVLSSRRKKKAPASTWTVQTSWIGEQPFLESSDLTQDDKRQEELFRLAYPIGGVVSSILVPDAEGVPVPQDVRVARIGRSLRSGYPYAKVGLSVYFSEWEGTEFPVSFPVKASDKVVSLDLDADGVTARDAAGATVWTSPWTTLLFSNGPDILLSGGDGGRTVRVEYSEAHPELEELLIKYGTLKQMHF